MQATSREAILYILRELGRRAGATSDWIAKWRVEFQDGRVVVHLQPDSSARLVFPFDPSKRALFQQLLEEHPRCRTWLHDPGEPLRELIPSFIVPFDDRAAADAPLLTSGGADSLECGADILTAALWTLSRLEESVPGPADNHGRMPASGSASFRFGYLERPIVDEYALALRQAISHLIPGWKAAPAALRVKLSHDIDLVGFPRSLRSTVGHIYPRRLPQAFFRDTLSLAGMGNPAYLESVLETARISRETGFDSSFYWKAAARTAWDSGYNPLEPPVRQVIERLAGQGFEMGVHPAYETFNNPEALEAEVERLRRVLGKGPMGGRQHFLRWRPFTWLAWEKAGLAYDSSVGFADAMGFRAGTSVPYHPWLIDENRESTLLEIPLIVMDCTPVEYMRLGTAATLTSIATLVRRSEAAGGVFTLLWHNSSVMEHPYASLYPQILSLLPTRTTYDWKAEPVSRPLPREIGS